MEETITITRHLLNLAFLISFLLGLATGVILTSLMWLFSALKRFCGGVK